MAGRFLQCRVDDETRDRAEKAAADCAQPVGTWLRMVVDDALDAHFDVELVESESRPGVFHEVRRRLGLCSCDGFANAGHCWHLDEAGPGEEPEAEERPLDGSVVAALTESPGVVPVVEHPGQERPRTISPRDCPCLPQWKRASGVCSQCGSRKAGGISARMTR